MRRTALAGDGGKRLALRGIQRRRDGRAQSGTAAAQSGARRTEQVEAHLLLLLLRLRRLLRRRGRRLARRRRGIAAAAAAATAAAAAARGHGGHLGLARREDLNQVLALKGPEQLLELLRVWLDTDAVEDRRHVLRKVERQA